MPTCLPEEEGITRFLYEGEYDREMNVKGNAFTPKKGSSALSVCRTGEIEINGTLSSVSDPEIWQIGREHVGKKGKKEIAARTDFPVKHVLAAKEDLIVTEKSQEFERHAHIEPFPVLSADASEDASNRFYAKRETRKNKGDGHFYSIHKK